MLIEVRRDLCIDFCELHLEPIAPGGVEIWDKNFLHSVEFVICGEMGHVKWEGIILWPWKLTKLELILTLISANFF